MTNEAFFDWAFKRHHNQWSWYLRPLFLVPYCYFAYKQSYAGVMISLFALLTSMFWFPEPAQVSDQVKEFLAFEKQYLTTNWNGIKILVSTLVPISLFLLAVSFWKRSIILGVVVIILMALGKVFWSVTQAGEAGLSIIIPAIAGLAVCLLLVIVAIRRIK